MGIILSQVIKYTISCLEPVGEIETCTISENYKRRLLSLLPELIRDSSLVDVGFGYNGFGFYPFGAAVYVTLALEATKRPITFTIGA